jgi:hypothetical protein
MYNPSVYRRGFVVTVAQYPAGPVLIVQEQARTPTPTGADSEVTAYLDVQQPGRVRYYDYAANQGYQTFDTPPELQTLPTLTVGGRSYQNVLRLSNPYAAQRGSAGSITAYYVHPELGLLRFEQRDGTQWDLTP